MKDLLAGFGVFVLACSVVDAQTVTIEHHAVGCAAAGKFPRLEARLAPAETVATARLVFQGQTNDWYSVAMKPEGAVFVGVLPKPKKELKSFRYYIEVTDKALGTNRTADFTASVVDGSGACNGKTMAGALGTASVVLQGPAGAAALPAGFASTGVAVAGSAAGTGSAVGATGAAGSGAGVSGGAAAGAAGAGGGGLSATTIGVVGGVVAGGALVATQVVGGGTTYAGPFQTSTTFTRLGQGDASKVLCTVTLAIVGTLRIEDLDGGQGHLFGEWSETESGGTCGYPTQNDRVDGDLTGGANGNIQFSASFSGDSSTGSGTRTRSFSGALTGGSIVGTWTMSAAFRSVVSNGGFITEAYPATGAPVTLQRR
jgi:hypothetical protein